MRVKLIETEGRGGAALIEFEDQRLRVVDRLSRADQPAAPGPVQGARLEVVVNPHLTGRAAAGASAGAGLEADHGWRYRATGEIVSTQPLTADLGGLRLALERSDTEDWAIGERVSLAIDRIVLTGEEG